VCVRATVCPPDFPTNANDPCAVSIGSAAALSSGVRSSPFWSPPPNIFPTRSGACHKPTLRPRCPAGSCGSKKNIFADLVAPNVLGFSTLLVRPPAALLMKRCGTSSCCAIASFHRIFARLTRGPAAPGRVESAYLSPKPCIVPHKTAAPRTRDGVRRASGCTQIASHQLRS
jgi:hypothetical protein